MKKLISCCFLFISLAASSQTLSYTTFEDEEDAMPSTVLESNSTERDKTISLDSRKAILSNRANRLLKKADELFDMMWYAEAAKYYEQGLKKINGIPSKHILQRAGDAQYYTSNMERAHFWYGLLYENYKNELSADHIFKYAHALKGNSKYGKAKRMMRLYRKVHAVAPGHSKREKVLETILGTSQEAEIKNMAINSKYSEFSPMFFNQDKIVYASAKDSGFLTTRRYKWNNQPYLDLYVARINKTSLDLKGQKKFSKKVNTKYHEASVTFSPDGQTMYFTRNNSNGKRVVWGEKKVNHLKIYKSVLVNGEWSEAMELPFNSNEYSTGHPALSPDGKLLYFVSDRPGSMGKTDIFVVDVLENGNFSAPRNLGPEVNTGEREMFPFVNNEKLYFSSDGHTGLGGLDIFQAMYENGGFHKVTNLGQPINSSSDDFSYIVREETKEGYFASNRKGGKGDDDIYSFKLLVPEEATENLNAITGVISESLAGEVLPNALVVLLDENNKKLKQVVTNEDGSFVFEELESNTDYTIKIEQNQYFKEEIPIATLDNRVIETEIKLKKLKNMIVQDEGVKKLETEAIFFDFDQSSIRDDAAKELDKLVAVMNEYPSMVIKIESHTDALGSRQYNKFLSDKRAKSTKDYLISKGIDSDRIESAIGYGEEHLLNDCNDNNRCGKEKHRQNRRSEFIIVNM